MKKLSMLKLVVIAAMAMFVAMSGFQGSAFALSAESPKKQANVGGHSYSYYSTIHQYGSSTWAQGTVEVSTGLAPSMGIDAKLYTSKGKLVVSSGWQFSNYNSSYFTITSPILVGEGTHYAKSQMKFYKGNSYSTYTSNATPILQSYSLLTAMPEEAYAVNENGLTYGTDFYAESLEDSPDLVAVIGTNGVEGYVYAKELYPELTTFDEVTAYINSGQQSYTVPVYAEDGVTIVDSFTIGTKES
ncbi:hypothetical protein MHB44_18665 [Lysinibacillus sp. FSL H8-0500]|uniref:hypothetical protein n=1 Tax=Lysinibacillus TaxID=400634 RepID=UPI0006B6706C|nr:hypothetical protein [Lysinibacillus macroides]QPR68139.1 hypothetical protein I6G82_00215 [Lysinibacillus macroides]